MAETTVQIAFRGTETYRDDLQRAALDRGMKVQQMLEEAVRTYLARPIDEGAKRRNVEEYALECLREFARLYSAPGYLEGRNGLESALGMRPGTLQSLVENG